MAGRKGSWKPWFVVLIVGVVGVGCAGYEDEELSTLKTRASFDLDCPKADIRTVTIDDETRGVNGCGKRAAYVHVCRKEHDFGSEEQCNWILNSNSHRGRRQSSDEE